MGQASFCFLINRAAVTFSPSMAARGKDQNSSGRPRPLVHGGQGVDDGLESVRKFADS
jgi:hypothetical protein